jgi:hypothetical protein
VARVKLLLEAGFHVGQLEAAGAAARAAPLAAGARDLLAAGGPDAPRLEADLHALVVRAWRDHLAVGPV